MLLYNKGHRFKFGGLEFEKQDNEEFGWWACLNSTYLVEHKDKQDEERYELRSQAELPMEQRYGFKWTDQQVKEYYGLKQ